ncbi:MAG: efflux RND transporter periplasmic adaptor subunit [Yoonia sp.]
MGFDLQNMRLGIIASAFLVLGQPALSQSEGFGINCAIRPLQIVEIAAPMNGIVSEVFVRPGATVQKGDLIAKFDSDISEATVAGAELRASLTAGRDVAAAQRDALEERVNRLRLGVERRAVSLSELESAELELTLAQGRLDQEIENLKVAEMDAVEARLALSKSEVRSPVSGQVGEDIIDVGESPQGRHVAIVYVNDPLRVEAYVPTRQLAAFLTRPGFEIIVNNDRTNPTPVTLDYVAQVADLSSNTQSVYFTLQADDILPGYQCLFPATLN